MYRAVQLQIVAFLVEHTGIRVPLHELPTVLGPTWYELDTVGERDVTSEDRAVLASCLSQTLVGKPWLDNASPPERLAFVMRLQEVAAARGWEVVPKDTTTAEAEYERIVQKFNRAAINRTDEVLFWFRDVSGVVLSEADLKQLPAVTKTLGSIYRNFGLDNDTPDLAGLRAQSLALWLLNEPWPETTAWEPNAAFVMKLQAAALSRGLGVEPERWRWERVRAFQEARHV